MSWEILLKKKKPRKAPPIPKDKNIRNPFKGPIRTTKNPHERRRIKQSMKNCPKFPNKITYQSKREAEREAEIQSKHSGMPIYVYQCSHRKKSYKTKAGKKREAAFHYHLTKQPPRDKK
mgnify:CR=1 FL=1